MSGFSKKQILRQKLVSKMSTKQGLWGLREGGGLTQGEAELCPTTSGDLEGQSGAEMTS